MIKVKDGYAKLIGTTYLGSASRVLLSNGGDHVLGNASGNIPLSNGTVNTNLNSDLLDGVHLAGYGGRLGVMRSWARGTYTTVNQYFGNGNIVVIDPKPTDDSTLSPNTIIFSLGEYATRNTLLAFMYERDEIKYRRAVDGPTWGAWKTIAFTDSDISGNAATASLLKSNGTTSVPTGLLFYAGWIPQGNTNNRSWCSPTGNYTNNSVKGEYGSIVRVNYRNTYYNELFFDANSARPSWRKITGTNSTGWKTLGLLEDIRPSGYVTSSIEGLSSYWGKLWLCTRILNYDDLDITFYIHSAHKLKRGFVHIRVRRNPVTTDGVTTYVNDVNMVQISGNIPTSDIRLYHDATTGKMELWLDVKTRWGVYNANVVSCTQRFGNEVIPIVGTLLSNDFTTVLTLPTYSYISLSNLNSNQIHVQQHTADNTEYPLVWSNLTNTSNITADLLRKSYNHLTYNPGLQRISVLKVHSTGQLLLSAATEVALRYGNTDATSVVLANEEFRPYSVANSKINLGNSSVRWKGLYALTGNFSGDVLVSGALKIGSNSTRNYIAFRGTTADGDGAFNHTYIGENIYNGTESSELVLFKGNDPASNAANPNGTGPDRIRHIAAGHLFQIYKSPVSGTFESVCTSTTPVNTLAINANDVTSYLNVLPSANNTLNLGSSSLKWANIYATTFIGSLSGNASTATNSDKLDGFHETDFFRYRGEIDTAYVDIDVYTSGDSRFKKINPGIYGIPRSNHSEMLISFAKNTGSTSSLELKTSWEHSAKLFVRKTIDANRISGAWKALAYYDDIGEALNQYYWADIKISGTSSTTTKPTFATATATTSVTTPLLSSTGRLTLNATHTGVDLTFNNDHTKSVILNGVAFKPFDNASDKLTLGSNSARWSNVYSVLGNFTGNVTLYSASGDSPHLYFLRGTTTDGTYDWDMFVTGGLFVLRQNNSGTWNNALLAYNNSMYTNWKFGVGKELSVKDERFNYGLTYYSGSSTVTGTIVITLPNGWTSSMNTYEIDIYEYRAYALNADNILHSKLIIDGYNYNGNDSWINYGYTQIGSYNKGVRLGYNGSKCVIMLGTTSTTWNYPQVHLSRVITGYGAQTTWTTGYSISVITDESSYSSIVTANRLRLIFADVVANTFRGTLSGRATSVGSDNMIMYPQYTNEINFGGSDSSSTLYFGYRATDSRPIPTSFVFGSSNGTATLTGSGFIKKDSSNSYVLLGGGGHKALSTLQSEYDSRYVNITGDTMTGRLSMKTTIKDHSLPTDHCLVINSDAVPSGTTLTLKNAPGIGFHISSYDWGSLVFNGKFNFIDNTSNGYMDVNLKALSASSTISGNYFTSRVATGTQPYACTSTTLNTNLNADLLDGLHLNSIYTLATADDFGTTSKVPSGFLTHYTIGTDYTNSPLSLIQGNLFTVINHLRTSSKYGAQLAFGFGSDYLAIRRRGDSTTWRAWSKIKAGSADNADTLDGIHANGLLTALSSNTTNKVSITVGGTTKNITTLYASYLCSVGVVNPLTGRTLAYGNVYSYNTNLNYHEGAPTTYTSVIGFGRGAAGGVEICGEWTSGRGLWVRALRDTTDDWYAWDRILTEATYKTVLDSRYYTETEVNNKLAGYLPLAGGTMSSGTAQIQRAGSSTSWYLGRTNAMIRINSYSGYNAIASMKTTNGDWSLGVHSNNVLYFTYITDTNFNAGTNNTTALVYINAAGNVYATHFYEHSDINLKTNIKPIVTSDNIPLLKSFDWKSDGSHSYGLIAQELEEQGYSELVSDEGGLKTVKYSAALSLIVGKLQVKIRELEKEIENLKNKN